MKIQERIGEFFSRFPVNNYAKGDIIINSGTNPCQVHFVTGGLVSEYCLSPSGGMFTLHIYSPGSFFPICLFCVSGHDLFTQEAFTAAQTRSCPVDVFMEFISSDREMMMEFTTMMGNSLSAMAKRLSVIANTDTYSRTVSALLYLGENFGRRIGGNGTILIEHHFSHREIASWMGTARETASLNLKKLERDGLIKYDRQRILIPSLSALTSLLEG